MQNHSMHYEGCERFQERLKIKSEAPEKIQASLLWLEENELSQHVRAQLSYTHYAVDQFIQEIKQALRTLTSQEGA